MVETDPKRGAEFKQALIDLLETATREEVEFAIEYLWCFRRMSVLSWFNRHFFKIEVKERE